MLLPFEGPLADDLRAAGVGVRLADVPVLRRETFSPAGAAGLAHRVARFRRALRAHVARDRVDVVHANTSVLLGLRVAPRLTVHVREIYPPVPLAWPAHRRALGRADALVCVSDAVRTALQGLPRAHVVPDGLPPAAAARPPATPADRHAARAALHLPQDGVIAAVLGRLSAWKGQRLLLEAAADPRLRGLRVLVAGDAWPGQEHHERDLRTLAAGCGIADRVHFTGFRADVEAVYAAADVVVVPSTAPDPLPNSALEAAAAGRPVVAAAHGGLPEIVRDGFTGRLFAPGDAGALATVLAELAADPGGRDRLGAAAAQDVRARFPSDGPARALEALWRP